MVCGATEGKALRLGRTEQIIAARGHSGPSQAAAAPRTGSGSLEDQAEVRTTRPANCMTVHGRLASFPPGAPRPQNAPRGLPRTLPRGFASGLRSDCSARPVLSSRRLPPSWRPRPQHTGEQPRLEGPRTPHAEVKSAVCDTESQGACPSAQPAFTPPSPPRR